MRFLQPDAAAWLLAIPVIWAAWLLHRWYRNQARRVSGFGPRLTRLTPMAGTRHDLLVFALAGIAVAALVCAVARPQVRVRTPEPERLDLIVLLDRSVSMHADDVHPSRLSRATEEIRYFLQTKPETISRVALIGFAGTSLVLSHLTRDVEILFFYLDTIEADREVRYGTDMARALDSALKLAAKDRPELRKLVVLISDGDNQGDPLERVIGGYQAQRIPVYCIGIGSDNEVVVPAFNLTGSRQPLRNDQGTILRTRFSELTLRRLAGVTGGRYFRSITGQELSSALADIAAREQRIASWRDEYRDVHGVALGVAAVALAGLVVFL